MGAHVWVARRVWRAVRDTVRRKTRASAWRRAADRLAARAAATEPPALAECRTRLEARRGVRPALSSNR